MSKVRWEMGAILSTVDVVMELLHKNPMYFQGKWYHYSFIHNWTFIYIKRRAQQGFFRMAIKHMEGE